MAATWATRLSSVRDVPTSTPILTNCSRCSGEAHLIVTVMNVLSPASSRMTVPTEPIASNTSRSGGAISRLTNLNRPPGRRSTSQSASRTPEGSHQQMICSGRVHASNTRSRGASKLRVMVIVCAARSIIILVSVALAVAAISRLLLLHRREVSIEIVEPVLPLLSKGLDPIIDILESRRHELARPPLRIAPALDEAGVLEHLEVFRDRRLAEFERLHQLRNRRFAGRQPRKDRAPRGIGERRERAIQTFNWSDLYRHSSI